MALRKSLRSFSRRNSNVLVRNPILNVLRCVTSTTCLLAKQKVKVEEEELVGPGMSWTHCTGANIYKDKEDPVLKDSSEYPDWLWTISGEKYKLEDFTPESKIYWRLKKRYAAHEKNRLSASTL